MSLSCIAGLSRFRSPSYTYCCSSSSSTLGLRFSFSFSNIGRGLLEAVSTRNQRQQHQQQRRCTTMASSSSDVPQVAVKQEKITAPYGSWKSPITADVVSGASKRLGGTAVDAHGRLIWLESRPSESGCVLISVIYLHVHIYMKSQKLYYRFW